MHTLHPHQQYTAKYDPVSKVYNIFFWIGIKKQVRFVDSKPILEDVLEGDIIDIAKTEKEVWEKLLTYRMNNDKLRRL